MGEEYLQSCQEVPLILDNLDYVCLFIQGCPPRRQPPLVVVLGLVLFGQQAPAVLLQTIGVPVYLSRQPVRFGGLIAVRLISTLVGVEARHHVVLGAVEAPVVDELADDEHQDGSQPADIRNQIKNGVAAS